MAKTTTLAYNKNSINCLQNSGRLLPCEQIKTKEQVIGSASNKLNNFIQSIGDALGPLVWVPGVF